MERKKYIKPEMEEVDLHQESNLLCESGEWCDEMGSIIPTDINKQV